MAESLQRTKRVKISDVAQASGFALSTVSVVLNDTPVALRVSEPTKAHIKKIAAELGYRPNIFARSLRGRRSQTIGLMVFDISDPFCNAALDSIESKIEDTNYLPLIMDARGNKERYERYITLLVDRQIDGLIIVANWLLGESTRLLKIQNDIPLIIVGRDLSRDGIPSVTVDNEAGGYIACQHLYALGHREVAVIRGPKNMVDGHLRWKGIQRFSKENRWTINHVQQLPDLPNAQSAFNCGQRITQEFLQSSVKFTALIAFDDLTALGAIRALTDAKLRVPKDCSVIGFDDVLPSAVSTPGLTTIHQPLDEIGALTTECIYRGLQESNKSTAKSPLLNMLSPTLVLRESTQKCRR